MHGECFMQNFFSPEFCRTGITLDRQHFLYMQLIIWLYISSVMTTAITMVYVGQKPWKNMTGWHGTLNPYEKRTTKRSQTHGNEKHRTGERAQWRTWTKSNELFETHLGCWPVSDKKNVGRRLNATPVSDGLTRLICHP